MDGTDALNVLAYGASLAIIATYALTATGHIDRVGFDAANAIGCAPIIASEVAVGAWPALILTAAFGVVGWIGVLHEARNHRPVSPLEGNPK